VNDLLFVLTGVVGAFILGRISSSLIPTAELKYREVLAEGWRKNALEAAELNRLMLSDLEKATEVIIKGGNQ
jgi:hypothetical protein